MDTRQKLIHAVTEYDRRESRKPSYNMYALPQYFARVDEIMADVAKGADIGAAIHAGFTGRLAKVCAKAVNVQVPGTEPGNAWYYVPASQRK